MTIKLRQYLEENERQYHYRIKTVVPLDDEAMNKIERAIIKYLPVDISRVTKTIFQRHPLDFPGIENREVYFIDVATSLPASAYILQQEIRFALGIPEKFIVVRAPNEPTEVETQRLNAIADMEEEAASKGLEQGALLNDKDFSEANEIDPTKYYGDIYNARLTAYLKKIADERSGEKIDAPNAPFKWLDLPSRESQEPVQDTTDFNAHIDGAPRPASVGKAKDGPEGVSAAGNFDDNTRTYKRNYQDAKGKQTTLSKTGVAVTKKGE